MTAEEWWQRLSREDDELSPLFTIHLGQDWPEDYGHPWTNAIDAFVADNDRPWVTGAARELNAFLADGLSDGAVESIVPDRLHVSFDPGSHGFASIRAWLEAVRDELRARTADV